MAVPGPQFADHLWCGHGEHRAAGMSQAIAADSAVDDIPEPTPAPAAHHQQVIWPVGNPDERWSRRTPDDGRMNHQLVRRAAKRLVESTA